LTAFFPIYLGFNNNILLNVGQSLSLTALRKYFCVAIFNPVFIVSRCSSKMQVKRLHIPRLFAAYNSFNARKYL
jgi:hypothetical protein